MKDKPTCFECGGPAEFWHHVVPKSLGGTRTIPLCSECHGKVHDLDMTLHRTLMNAAVAKKKAAGEGWAHAPYGQTKDANGKLIDEPSEQQAIADVLDLRNQGLTMRAIVKEMNDRGTPHRTGKWHLQSVQRIIARAHSV